MYASLLKRLFSFIIDCIFLYALSWLLLSMINWPIDSFNLRLLAGIIALFYFVFMWKFVKGQTLGGLLLKIKVISLDNNQISYTNAFLRAGALFVFISPIGIIVLIAIYNIIETLILLNRLPFREKRQTAWDNFSKTIVVEK